MPQVLSDKDGLQFEKIAALRPDLIIGLYSAISAVRTEGRDVFVEEDYDDQLYGATSFVSVLSLPIVLDELVPKLAAAVDGNPATNG